VLSSAVVVVRRDHSCDEWLHCLQEHREQIRGYQAVVSLEITSDLPFGFPINNIISLSVVSGTFFVDSVEGIPWLYS